MSKVAIGLLISVVVAGNAVTIAFLLRLRDSAPASAVASGADRSAVDASLVEAIEALRQDLDRLALEATARAAPSVASAALATPPDGTQAAPLDEVLKRLEGIEASLAAMRDVDGELAAARLREKRQEQFRADDGFTLVDELLEQKQFGVAANGILTFLEAHPDHPDARDLMRKAADAFFKAGYGERALWLQGEILKKFPDQRGEDLYSLAMLEKQLRKLDDALLHTTESVELATTDQSRMNRMFYRAYLIHERDGDAAGLEAYREVERLARAAGIEKPATEAGRRAEEIHTRLAGR